MPVKVLITGMAGFIGFHLARRMAQLGHRVFGVDSLNRYYDVELKLDRLRQLGIEYSGPGTITAASGLQFQHLDLTDAASVAALCAEQRFDVVCHFAAQAGVRYSLSDPFAYTLNNVHGFLGVLEAVRQTPVRHLVYASSSSVYGLDPSRPLQRIQRGRPSSQPVRRDEASQRVDGAQLLPPLRYSLHRPSPFHSLRAPGAARNMALFTFTRAILNGEQIDLYNHGKMERDFTYIDDVVEAVLRVIAHPPHGAEDLAAQQSAVSPVPARVYNVGCGQPVSLHDLGKTHSKARTWADTTALRETFSYTPRVGIREGAQHFVAWFRDYMPSRPV